MESIIEIKEHSNGVHNVIRGIFTSIPEGYAIIPKDMAIPDTFPFVNIEVTKETRYNEIKHYNEETDEETVERVPYTVMVVTSMTEGVVPERPPEPIPEPTTAEIIDVLLGVTDDE